MFSWRAVNNSNIGILLKIFQMKCQYCTNIGIHTLVVFLMKCVAQYQFNWPWKVFHASIDAIFIKQKQLYIRMLFHVNRFNIGPILDQDTATMDLLQKMERKH